MMSRFFSSLVSVLFISLLIFNSAQAATITVTEPLDSFNMGNCSLRDAVQSFNTGADFGGCTHTGGDYVTDNTIILLAQTYTLSLTGDNDDNTSGDLDILDFDGDMAEPPLLIQGQGMDATIVTGGFPPGEEDRIFDILPGEDGGRVTLADLTVSNGGSLAVAPNGGGIRNHLERLILQGVHVRDNFGEDGGGIFNPLNGKILMTQSRVTGNTATDFGGGIYSDGVLAIDESTIDGNEAFDGGGFYRNEEFGQFLAIYNSTISRNKATGFGQGGGGGGLTLNACAPVFIVNSTISENQANTRGGGVNAFESGCINGGGGNGQPIPPGIHLLNDTISDNVVLEQGGQGGGIFYFFQEEANIKFGTFGLPDIAGFIGLGNSILAGNSAEIGPDCYNRVESFGFNLIQDPTACSVVSQTANPDVPPQDPLLGMLQNNGGPTETQGLMALSPAIDTANNIDGCQAPDFNQAFDIFNLGNLNPSLVELTRDQRNFPRPIAVLDPNNPICDIGAFEYQVFGFTVTKDDGLGGEEIPVGTSFDYTITVTNNGPGSATAVTLDDPLPAGMEFVSVNTTQGACAAIGEVIGCDLGDLAVGETATITVTVIATEAGTFTNIVTVALNNPFQQQLTETAQVTTVVTSDLFVFGSGFHCELQRGAVQAAPGRAMVLGLMALAVLGIPVVLRGRASR